MANTLEPDGRGTAEVPKTSVAPTPWYSSPRFWTGPFMIAVGLVVGAGLGYSWYTVGGFPRDHDRYGTVEVPGERSFKLPEGDVRINFENEATPSSSGSHLEDAPEGLAIRVTTMEDDEVDVDRVSSWTYSSVVGDRGHEPFGKVDIPQAGTYLVQASDRASGGFEASRRGGAGDGEGPEIALGATPWTPFGSKLAGAILCGVAVLLALLLFSLPFRFVIPRD